MNQTGACAQSGQPLAFDPFPKPVIRPVTDPAKDPRDTRPRQREETPTPAQRAGADGERPREIGGRRGPEPTRYGDWEKNGRCIDF